MLTTTTDTTPDQLERELLHLEGVVARIRARQIALLAWVDQMQLPAADGARNLHEWVGARLDVTSDTARTLVAAARTLPDHPEVIGRLTDGEIGLDRAVLTAELATIAPQRVGDADGWDLGGLQRLVAAHRSTSRRTDRQAFADRYLSIQPALDESTLKGRFLLPGFDGDVLLSALAERADQFADGPGPRIPRPARMADALVSIAQDSLDPVAPDGDAGGREPMVSVFVDAAIAAPTRGRAGATVAGGSRVGPDVLEELLCTGRIGVVHLDDGLPISATPTTRAIPPAIRRLVLHRDGGCTIAGCHSRYRLQPHHLRPYADGGSHHPENLTTLCWFHHHVVVHRLGYRLDPASPPRRRRFLRSRPGHDPPEG